MLKETDLPLQVLKQEVELMSKMAKTIDGFTENQTRMAVIIDGLDACEQDRVLQMLDTVSEHLVFVSLRVFRRFLFSVQPILKQASSLRTYPLLHWAWPRAQTQKKHNLNHQNKK